MYRLLIIACAIMFVMALGAQAVTPPDPPAHGPYNSGWGFNPTNWNAVDGSFYFDGIYRPIPSQGGMGWYSIPGLQQIAYTPINIQLWIEMRAIQTYAYTTYQYHRIGLGAEDITFLIQGTVQSNEDLFVSLTRDPLNDGSHLFFIGNEGAGQDLNTNNIPITWTGRWGTGLAYGIGEVWPDNVGGYAGLYWDGLDLTLGGPQIPPTAGWFEFRGAFTIPYNQGDGYYALTLGGCPAPEM